MSSILQKQVGINSAAVTLVTTAETLLAYSGRVEITYQTIRSIVKGYLQGTWGTAATGVITRIRRGNGLLGAVFIGGATELVTAVTSSDLSIKYAEQLLNAEFADYSLTVQQVAATGNGSVSLATIEVEMING